MYTRDKRYETHKIKETKLGRKALSDRYMEAGRFGGPSVSTPKIHTIHECTYGFIIYIIRQLPS